MLIAVISDTHDNIFRLQKAVVGINNRNINIVFHCGDIGLETIKILKKEKFIVYAVCGNSDDYNVLKDIVENSNIKLFEDAGECTIDNINIAITHYPDFARLLASSKKYNIIFYGHTHKRKVEEIYNTQLINPGDIEGRNRCPSFLIYNTANKGFEFINI